VNPLLTFGEKDDRLRLERVRVRQHIGHVVLGLFREDRLGAGCEVHAQQPRSVDAHAGEQVGRRSVPAEAVHPRRHEIFGWNVEPRFVLAGGQVAEMDDRASLQRHRHAAADGEVGIDEPRGVSGIGLDLVERSGLEVEAVDVVQHRVVGV
jgi:hypothetical protein